MAEEEAPGSPLPKEMPTQQQYIDKIPLCEIHKQVKKFLHPRPGHN